MNGITRITRLGPAAVLTAGLMACDAAGPTAPRDSGLADVDGGVLASRIQGPRPLRGSLNGIGVPGDPCSAEPPGVMVTGTARGIVSHLGAATLVQTACLSVPDFLPLGPSVASLTAANGDRLDGLVTALVFRSDGFDMEIGITGGSGRFAQAGGRYGVRVVQSAPLEPFAATLEGWIEY